MTLDGEQTQYVEPTRGVRQPAVSDIFLGWLWGNRSKFRVEAIPGTRKEDTITFSFSFLKRYLKGYLRYDKDREHIELTVVAEDKDTEYGWDILFDNGTRPVLVDGEWICNDCLENEENASIAIFNSLDELLVEHLFEHFLEWINTKLAVVDSWAFIQWGGCTTIKLAGDLIKRKSTP
jgi:hypothetical protein